MSEALYITDGFGRKRFIGYVYGQTLHMEREHSKHYFRKYKGWAIDKEAFESRPDILLFILRDKETKTNYLATRRDFNIHNIPMEWDGHLPQFALPEKHWSVFK
jgi:hypothetical protein